MRAVFTHLLAKVGCCSRFPSAGNISWYRPASFSAKSASLSTSTSIVCFVVTGKPKGQEHSVRYRIALYVLCVNVSTSEEQEAALVAGAEESAPLLVVAFTFAPRSAG
jgi:hypothetical protein